GVVGNAVGDPAIEDARLLLRRFPLLGEIGGELWERLLDGRRRIQGELVDVLVAHGGRLVLGGERERESQGRGEEKETHDWLRDRPGRRGGTMGGRRNRQQWMGPGREWQRRLAQAGVGVSFW